MDPNEQPQQDHDFMEEPPLSSDRGITLEEDERAAKEEQSSALIDDEE